MPRLTIVVVTFNSAGHIGACLASLTECSPAVPHEIIVVDNASSDDTVALLRRDWPAVRVMESGGNVGFAAANNRAIRGSTSDLVLLLNPDTVVPMGAVDGLVARLDERSDVAIVGPRLIDSERRVELSWGAMIGPLAELRQKVLVRGHEGGNSFVTRYVERLAHRTREVDWVSGACLVARRADLEAVGLLDERYFMYAEDVDVCAAVRARGRAVLFDAGVEVQHVRGLSRASAPGPTAEAYRLSQLAFYDKHHPSLAGLLRLYLRIRGVLPGREIR